jgi:hypothetical protein
MSAIAARIGDEKDSLMRLAKTLLVCLFGVAVACSDRSPTSPEAALSTGTSLPESISAQGTRRRPVPRVVAPRGATDPALQGAWGGDDIRLAITASGASLEFDCAAGTIDAPFLTDASGHFNLPGSTWFTPPVVFENWQPDRRPARYSGVVEGNLMTLTVTRLEDGITTRFTLARNAVPRLLKCV